MKLGTNGSGPQDRAERGRNRIDAHPPLRILQALPRQMRFERTFATSVELCVSDWVSGSRYRSSTTILAEASSKPPLADLNVSRSPPARYSSSFELAAHIRERARRNEFDIIVMQQHIPTAARVAFLARGVPLVLQTHNFVDAPVKGPKGRFLNWLRRREFSTLSGMTFVSHVALNRFKAEWPGVTMPFAVVQNGFDFSSWQPQTSRTKTILVVGRAQPEKGLLEAAEGARLFLADRPDWTAVFVISEPARNQAYFEQVRSVLSGVADRVDLLTNSPYERVKALTEQVAVVVVASRWEEPFGRTALEAHAGGAALISSGTGGLREVSGDNALFLPACTGEEIRSALNTLADDDALSERLARGGASWARANFSLMRTPDCRVSVCDKLDLFLEQVGGRGQDTALPVTAPS